MPRRKKPLYRPRNILLALIALTVLAVGRQVYLALTAKPGKSVNYSALAADLIQKYQPASATPDSPNAYELLDQAITIESQVQADIRAERGMPGGQYPVDYSTLMGPFQAAGPYKEVLPEIQAHSREAIEALRKTELFSLLSQAAATPRAVRPTPQGRLIDMLLPSLGKYRNFARLNGARMYMASVSGDDTERVQAFEQTLAIGRVAAHGSFLIEALVGIAIDALALGELVNEIVEKPPSEATLLACLAAIDRQPLPPIRLAMEGERLGTLDTIQWTHTDDGAGSGRLITTTVSQLGVSPGAGPLDRFSQWRIFNIGGAAFPSKAANIRKANGLYDLILKAVDTPYYQRIGATAEIENYIETLPNRYIVLKAMFPAIGKSMQSRDQLQVQLNATRVIIALEIFRHRNGHYPQTLDELAPSILPQLPVDPFTGKNFGYQVLDPANDPDLRRYTVYSFGADQIDNRGSTKPKDAWAALRLPAGRGFDFILNPGRTKPEPPDPNEVPVASPTPEPQAPAPDAEPTPPKQP